MVNQEFATALHILSILAYTGELVSSDAIAMSVRTNAALIRKFAGILSAAGLVKTERGANGGIRLARPAAEITLADIYRALNPPPVIAKRATKGLADCPVGSKMDAVVGGLSGELEHQLLDGLSKKTLADVVRKLRR